VISNSPVGVILMNSGFSQSAATVPSPANIAAATPTLDAMRLTAGIFTLRVKVGQEKGLFRDLDLYDDVSTTHLVRGKLDLVARLDLIRGGCYLIFVIK